MKKIECFFRRGYLIVLLVTFTSLFSAAETNSLDNQQDNIKSATKYVHQSAGNPYLPLWEHLPDGEP